MFEYWASPRRFIDGDTVELDIDLGFHIVYTEKVRLAGIDAPERGTDAGRDAASWLRVNMPSSIFVRTEKDRKEKYGRYLAWLWPIDLAQDYRRENSLNMLMVAAGMARHSTGRR